jgi:hypothetical protein
MGGDVVASNGTLTARLLRLVDEWETLAAEARQRAGQRRPNDLPPAYLYGSADQLEQNARAVRELIKAWDG